MQVSADTFRASTGTGATYPLLVLLGVLAALAALWLPLLALLMSIYGLLLSVSDTFAAPLPGLARSRDSQNIVATRARAGAEDPTAPLPPWRVVLLAPLDAPRQTVGGWYWAPRHLDALIGRMLAFAMLGLLCVLLLFAPRPLWQSLLLVPVGYLCFSLLPRPSNQASLAGGSGALAVLLAASERLNALHGVEIWTVALGATTTGSSGLQDLLARYPFPPENTLFVVLPNIAGEQLFYATYEGVLRQHAADPLLLQLAEELSDKDPLVSISPRPYHSASSIAAVLHNRGYRALTIHSHSSAQRRIPSDSDDEALAATFNYQMLEQAIRLLVGLVRLLNQDERTHERRQSERRSARQSIDLMRGYERRRAERRQSERRRG
jgi:hypothetical protein